MKLKEKINNKNYYVYWLYCNTTSCGKFFFKEMKLLLSTITNYKAIMGNITIMKGKGI